MTDEQLAYYAGKLSMESFREVLERAWRDGYEHAMNELREMEVDDGK